MGSDGCVCFDLSLNPTTSVIQVKQGSQRYSLYFSQEGGLLHEKILVMEMIPIGRRLSR